MLKLLERGPLGSVGQRVPAADCAASMRATRYYRRAWELRGGHSPPHALIRAHTWEIHQKQVASVASLHSRPSPAIERFPFSRRYTRAAFTGNCSVPGVPSDSKILIDSFPTRSLIGSVSTLMSPVTHHPCLEVM